MAHPQQPGADAPPVIEMLGIVKRFPGVVANDGIDLVVLRGEIHALLGENGAGKSTLMNVLFGLYRPDEGVIRVDGKPAAFAGPRQAVGAGLGMVHQHFMLIPRFSVTENVILGAEGNSTLHLDRDAAEQTVGALAEEYGLRVDPRAKLADLPVGMQQRVEILRALYQGSRTLILDEPTALLTPQEVDELYAVLHRLREGGGTIIFITHKLREVAAISDRVTVIRRGKTVGTRITKETTAPELAELMVGREVILRVERPPASPGEPVLVAENLVVTGSRGEPALRGLDLTLRRGEILGICGVEGNGQTELVETLAGLRRPDSGRVRLKDQDVTGQDPIALRRAGLSYIPEDRHNRGLVLDFPLTENVLLGNTEAAAFSRGWRILRGALDAITRRLMRVFDVRAPSPQTHARALSGGNQQKLIIARELHREPDALLAAQPTRGVDVGAIEFVHRQLVRERDQGRGVLLISFDLDEILDLSDRILVLFGGRIVGEFVSGRVSRTELGLRMGGRGEEERGGVAVAD
ncbi:MAG: ABC transporter, ATP-binding protein (cluster 11, riboflavin/purine nucleoside/unknown) / ABC transporter, ATP-binding protein (cluster 11, riboflavin/purine nucleoside/unknown) [uncultured Thermomicrobiales bacterium]|uniref:ABC transporter domain-containing protein n=1 Tax=uncultured Thermomicrobiales bacterium TaxID=1645740 RepID=A0A6J4U1C6_9BACT|nr:MAG: ABC transporter, ATP-binding protein (cluster 11, riboflavin/purine nucleoside/unknown) / ABC transporter, ATP-binding protein (cluster 11, riboflavin/purine nucleoside/unknown) [uncultured Thermomicrobiales bacterium]